MHYIYMGWKLRISLRQFLFQKTNYQEEFSSHLKSRGNQTFYIIYDLAFSKECQPPGRRIQILAVKNRRKNPKISFHNKNLNLKKCFCLKQISSCWMKIWGTIKSKDGDERRKKKRRRANVSVNNGPALVPGVFFSLSLYVYCFSPPLRNTKEAKILFAPIFWHN